MDAPMKPMNAAPPVVERLNGGQPVLIKDENHPWENKVTFNPACALVVESHAIKKVVAALSFRGLPRDLLLKQPALVGLLYRAQGRKTEAYDHTRSALGLAICSPRLQLLFRCSEPVVLPDMWYDDLGVEDPRITRIGDHFIMIYTGYSTSPEGNRVRICIASSDDLVHWSKHGPLQGAFNNLDNKNGMLFEPTPDRKLLMLHRPMEGESPMMVHWAQAVDLLGEWESRGVLLPSQANPKFKDVWVGGGAPPLLLSDGRYLIFYHIGNRDAGGSREYDLGLALCDFSAAAPIVKRSEPLLRPETMWETNGDAELGVNNVVFVCGAYFWEGDLYFPYAGADSCVLAARIRKADLENWIR
jgi:beta-1,2-mannobiose phosphorylase / 1,2-beta-oligomannan phosphorylase